MIDLLCAGLVEYRLYAFELSELINVLATKYPDLLLDAVFDGTVKGERVAYLLFKDRGCSEKHALSGVSTGRLLAWCGDDQERIIKVSCAVDAYFASDPNHSRADEPRGKVSSEHIKSLLEAATEKLAVVEAIFNSVRPGTWSNSLANILEARSMALAELLEHADPKVQALVKAKLTLLEQKILIERELEAAEHNEREQRFE